MIKIIFNNKILEGRSKSAFLGSVARDIKNFIIDQLKNFSNTYFKSSDGHELKISDIPSISNRPELSNLKNLLLIINKTNQKASIKIPKASYKPSLSGIRVFLNVNELIKNFNEIENSRIQYIHKALEYLLYHELIHHLQYVEYKNSPSTSRPISSISVPIYPYLANTEGASEKEIKEYEYFSSPREIEAYARDTHYRSKKERTPFEKSLATRIRFAKENIFTSRKGKYLYFVIIYNFLKYAIERFPSANTEKNKQTLKKYENFLDENK